MAYSTSNPPQLIAPSIGAKPSLWMYLSTHTSTEVAAAGFVTNGQGLGFKVHDVVITVQTTGTVPVLGRVSAVSSTGITINSTV